MSFYISMRGIYEFLYINEIGLYEFLYINERPI